MRKQSRLPEKANLDDSSCGLEGFGGPTEDSGNSGNRSALR
jgi:hypothetical protein